MNVRITNRKKLNLALATGTGTHLEDLDVQILIPNITEMFVTEIAVENRVVLVGSRKYILHAESAVTEAYMFRGRRLAPVPTAFDIEMHVHGATTTLTSRPFRRKENGSRPIRCDL